jgi:Uma2 family endonuclease
MATARQALFISEDEYLESEITSAVKREYVDGHVYAMAGAHSNHNLIAGNVLGEFRNHLKGKPCRAYMSDMKVRIGSGSRYYYPDVLVNCPPVNGYYTETPTILVEVLSKSTRRTDETEKRMAYMQIETLQEYVLIEQDFVQVEVIRRNEGWQSSKYYLGDEVTLASIGLTLRVEEIYDGVQNKEMTKWLQQKAKQ